MSGEVALHKAQRMCLDSKIQEALLTLAAMLEVCRPGPLDVVQVSSTDVPYLTLLSTLRHF